MQHSLRPAAHTGDSLSVSSRVGRRVSWVAWVLRAPTYVWTFALACAHAVLVKNYHYYYYLYYYLWIRPTHTVATILLLRTHTHTHTSKDDNPTYEYIHLFMHNDYVACTIAFIRLLRPNMHLDYAFRLVIDETGRRRTTTSTTTMTLACESAICVETRAHFPLAFDALKLCVCVCHIIRIVEHGHCMCCLGVHRLQNVKDQYLSAII